MTSWTEELFYQMWVLFNVCSVYLCFGVDIGNCRH